MGSHLLEIVIGSMLLVASLFMFGSFLRMNQNENLTRHEQQFLRIVAGIPVITGISSALALGLILFTPERTAVIDILLVSAIFGAIGLISWLASKYT